MNIGLSVLEKLGLYKPVDHDHKRFERLSHHCNKIESIFFSAAYFELSRHGVFTPQYVVSSYRLDFALVGDGFKLAIEIDGHDYHKTKKQRAADYQRERDLKKLGWRFIRFTGSDIYNDTQRCVKDVLLIVRTYNV